MSEKRRDGTADCIGFTTLSTTFEGESLKSYEGICELLPKKKMPEMPVNTGFTDI